KEALQKAVRSLEQDRWGLVMDPAPADVESLKQKIRIPTAERCFALAEGYRRGMSTQEMHELSAIDPWFLENIREIVLFEETILGSGPNRIGQGIEFDYACVHAAFALKEAGVEAIMVNCNPETVSTDYDTSDRLYFEPLTFEDVMNIVERERPRGVIVQFGGQTPLKLTVPLERAGVSILGTPPDAIDRAEDRQRFAALLAELGLQQAPGSTARSYEEAERIAQSIGYPVLVRPS